MTLQIHILYIKCIITLLLFVIENVIYLVGSLMFCIGFLSLRLDDPSPSDLVKLLCALTRRQTLNSQE